MCGKMETSQAAMKILAEGGGTIFQKRRNDRFSFREIRPIDILMLCALTLVEEGKTRTGG